MLYKCYYHYLLFHLEWSSEYLQAIEYGMATCCKTVVILSDDFTQELLPRASSIFSSILLRRSELLGGRIRNDVIVILIDPLCAIPPELFHVAKVYLDDSGHSWRRFFDLLSTSGMLCIRAC